MLHTILQRPHCPRDPPSWACLWLVGKTSHLHHGWSVSPQAEDLRSKRWVKTAAGAKTAGNGLSSSIARSRAPGRSLITRRQAGEGLKSRWELGALIIVPPSVALQKQQAGTQTWQATRPGLLATFKLSHSVPHRSLPHLSLNNQSHISASPASPKALSNTFSLGSSTPGCIWHFLQGYTAVGIAQESGTRKPLGYSETSSPLLRGWGV